MAKFIISRWARIVNFHYFLVAFCVSGIYQIAYSLMVKMEAYAAVTCMCAGSQDITTITIPIASTCPTVGEDPCYLNDGNDGKVTCQCGNYNTLFCSPPAGYDYCFGNYTTCNCYRQIQPAPGCSDTKASCYCSPLTGNDTGTGSFSYVLTP